MRKILGSVVVQETGRGVGELTVAAFARADGGRRSRIGSVTTEADGRFSIEYAEKNDGTGWNLELEVSVDSVPPRILYVDGKPREEAGPVETWSIRLPLADLVAAGVLGKHDSAATAATLPALGTLLARAAAETTYEAEVQGVLRARLEPRRAGQVSTAARFRDELVRMGRVFVAPTPAPVRGVLVDVRDALAAGLSKPAMARPRFGTLVISEPEREALREAAAADGTVPAALVEPMLFGDHDVAERTVIDLLDVACRTPRTLDEACTHDDPADSPQPGGGDPLRELADAVWAELQPKPAAGERRPGDADVRHRVEGLDLRSGPADRPGLFDFHALHIPFEDVWRDLVDEDTVATAAQLQIEVERLGGQVPAGDSSLADRLRSEARFLMREAPATLRQRNFSDSPLPARVAVTGIPDPMGDDGARWVSTLLDELERKLREPYRFTVYGADPSGAAINVGIVTTYRQVWRPLGYQAGKLVETVTLAPREERTFSRKVTTTAKRKTETKEKFRSVTRTEEQSTQRAVRDIVETAEHRTNLQASGSYGPVSGSLTVDDARTSSDTRQSFREAVRKASSEYESDRSVDVVFESSHEIVTEQAGKLVNPNDELAITYLFYQLQRRFHVSERLHRVTPVVLVAQPVPAPHEINVTWILQHDWILRRALLDPSFAPALDLVTGSLVGEESTVGTLRANLDQQRNVVAALRESLVAAHRSSEDLFLAVQRVIGEEPAEVDVRGIPEPIERIVRWVLSGGDEEANRRRLDAAREALARAESNERAITEQLQREQATLTVATDRWVVASRALLDKTVEVQRLRLHLKQNILHYMQAIWDHEPPDQRHFRLHRLPVPVVEGEIRYRLEDRDAPPLPPYWTAPATVRTELDARMSGDTAALGELADLDRPLGYKGNYAIFPMRRPELVARYLMVPYVDRVSGAHDPDHLGNLNRAELEEYFCCQRRFLAPEALAAIRPGLDEAHRRLLADPRPFDEVIVVPTDALFIAALPADRPLLEDYKLRHRAADAAKAEADAARLRLDNIRRGARILAGDLADPDIEKLTIVQGNPSSIVLPGDDS